MEQLLQKKYELLKQQEEIAEQLEDIEKQIEEAKAPFIKEIEEKHLPAVNIGPNFNIVRTIKTIKGRARTDYVKVADWLKEQGLNEVVDNNTQIDIKVKANVYKDAKKALKENEELLNALEAVVEENTTKTEDREEIYYNIIKIGE